jgi:transcriptional repressor NrdR
MRVFVIKKDGRREPFDRAKVVAGITKACEKRPVSRESVEQIADEVERRLRDELSEEVATTEIGAMVMERLRGVDEVAYVRFASVYKEFRDADSFLKEIEDVLRSPRAEPAAGVQPGLFDSQE